MPRHLAQADMLALPFADCRFDAVVSLDAMVYIPRGKESQAIHELVRVLAPGGLLVLRTAALQILRSRMPNSPASCSVSPAARIVQLAAENGVKVLRCTYANSVLMPIALAKFRIIEPLFGSEASSGVQPVAPWLDHLLFTALNVEASWLGAGRNLPVGQSLILIGERVGG